MTVKEIIDCRLEALRSEECACVTTLMDDGNITAKCDRCKEIEVWEEKCTCNECEGCLSLKIQALQSQPCECTYKTIIEQHPSVNEDGNDIVIDVEISVVDKACDRCIEIKEYQDILDKWAILDKANIDKDDYDKYEIIDGEIFSKETRSIDEVVTEVLTALKEHKWASLEYIQYNGHLQRYGNEDKLLMLETQELLEKGFTESVNWIHSDGEVVNVKDSQYIMNMRLTGGYFVESAFVAELYVAETVSKMSNVRDILGYDYKMAFDIKFKDELNKMRQI